MCDAFDPDVVRCLIYASLDASSSALMHTMPEFRHDPWSSKGRKLDRLGETVIISRRHFSTLLHGKIHFIFQANNLLVIIGHSNPVSKNGLCRFFILITGSALALALLYEP
jgi:hypothetical protein